MLSAIDNVLTCTPDDITEHSKIQLYELVIISKPSGKHIALSLLYLHDYPTSRNESRTEPSETKIYPSPPVYVR